MKRLLELTTCRGVLHPYLTSIGAKTAHPDYPWGKHITDECITTNIRSFQNPEFLDQTLNILKLIRSRKLATLSSKHKDHNPNLYDDCLRAASILENTEFDGYIIEISSLKQGTFTGPKYTEPEFYKILNQIKRETRGKPTLWITHANVIFSKKYISTLIEKNSLSYHDKVICEQQIKSRVLIDKYVKKWAGNKHRVLYPYDILKSIPGEDVFRTPNDWGHYNEHTSHIVKEWLTRNIKSYFNL